MAVPPRSNLAQSNKHCSVCGIRNAHRLRESSGVDGVFSSAARGEAVLLGFPVGHQHALKVTVGNREGACREHRPALSRSSPECQDGEDFPGSPPLWPRG